MRKITITILFFFCINPAFGISTFKDIKEKKTNYLDFILLKIENRLIQRHGILRAQPVAMRIQYEAVGSEVEFLEKDSQIVIYITGAMDKNRYKKKIYKPKLSDCNVLRNLLLYGKYGYSLITQKRNNYLTESDMEEIFLSKYLNNLSLTEVEKRFFINKTSVDIKILHPIQKYNISCKGKITQNILN